jgi:hypothetical protein
MRLESSTLTQHSPSSTPSSSQARVLLFLLLILVLLCLPTLLHPLSRLSVCLSPLILRLLLHPCHIALLRRVAPKVQAPILPVLAALPRLVLLFGPKTPRHPVRLGHERKCLGVEDERFLGDSRGWAGLLDVVGIGLERPKAVVGWRGPGVERWLAGRVIAAIEVVVDVVMVIGGVVEALERHCKRVGWYLKMVNLIEKKDCRRSRGWKKSRGQRLEDTTSEKKSSHSRSLGGVRQPYVQTQSQVHLRTYAKKREHNNTNNLWAIRSQTRTRVLVHQEARHIGKKKRKQQ